MKVNPLVRLTIEEVVAFRVTRVQAGVIWRRERTVPGLVAVENKGTRILPFLSTCRYTEVWNSKAVFVSALKLERIDIHVSNRMTRKHLFLVFWPFLSFNYSLVVRTLLPCLSERERKRGEKREKKLIQFMVLQQREEGHRISHCFFVITIYYPRTLHYYRGVYNPLSGLINIDMY